ncbi:hypothetical protein [Gulosibacter sp. 10]|uniref:hypothetical protein n=1 Tax=Gulosibacter sp. 10 TaxID=1255570 RepID=UPI00097F4EE2|nr:hypothetical protein [Gulosibacter sp. 10]SJM70221.1 hypothetical protein FM112_14875 [Gulosibacter sp. 10]
MIIWTRWGFLSFLAVGLGVLCAFGVDTLLLGGIVEGSPWLGALVLGFAALINFVLARWVYPALDKPRPVTITRPLQMPYRTPDGRVVTEETVPALDPEGRPVVVRPVSTLFFIPARYFFIILGLGAVALAIVALVTG